MRLCHGGLDVLDGFDGAGFGGIVIRGDEQDFAVGGMQTGEPLAGLIFEEFKATILLILFFLDIVDPFAAFGGRDFLEVDDLLGRVESLDRFDCAFGAILGLIEFAGNDESGFVGGEDAELRVSVLVGDDADDAACDVLPEGLDAALGAGAGSIAVGNDEDFAVVRL